jgi:hypothetical protein
MPTQSIPKDDHANGDSVIGIPQCPKALVRSVDEAP